MVDGGKAKWFFGITQRKFRCLEAQRVSGSVLATFIVEVSERCTNLLRIETQVVDGTRLSEFLQARE
jgi:hypothetical protein